MTTPEIDWRIEDWNPGHVRDVRAMVMATWGEDAVAGTRQVTERREFGAKTDAADRALVWVRETIVRLVQQGGV